ncbi:MAG TPA: acetate kinase, partial [Rhodoferax sp.]
SGGIGEHDIELRAQMGQRLAWLGVVIDPLLNQQAVGNEIMAIHTRQSRVQVWVVPTDEGLVAAREAARLI